MMGTSESHGPAPCGDSARDVRRVTIAGMLLNLGLSALKLVLGIVGSSQAVVADAVHSLSDMSTDVAILFGVRYWSAPADDRHPYGHSRIETMITALIGLALAGVGTGIGYNALVTLGERHAQQPGMIAAWGAFLSIVVKEFLYRWTARVGRRAGSPAVMANAWHHRSDALSSLPVGLAVVAAAVNPAWAFLDHVGAVVVSLFILYAAWGIVRDALSELVDERAAEHVCEDIRTSALSNPGVRSVHAVRTRRLGGGVSVDLHIMVDGGLTVREGHEISRKVKRSLLLEVEAVEDVLVHVEPYEGA